MPLARGCSPDWWDHVLYFHELLHSGYWLHGAQGVKQGAVLFFLGTAKCVPVLFVYCLPSKPCRQYITIHCLVVFRRC